MKERSNPYAGFKVLFGAGDIIEQLEDALERAKAGELDGVIIVGITEAGCGWTGAFVDGTPYPWPRLQAAVDTAQHDLVSAGLVDWK